MQAIEGVGDWFRLELPTTAQEENWNSLRIERSLGNDRMGRRKLFLKCSFGRPFLRMVALPSLNPSIILA